MRKKEQSKKPASSRRRRQELLEKLADLHEILRGTLIVRYRRCGRPNCHCARRGDPGHGPKYYLSVTTAPGKTVQVYVPKEQKEDVESWIDNFRRVREVLEDVSSINRELLKDGTLFAEE